MNKILKAVSLLAVVLVMSFVVLGCDKETKDKVFGNDYVNTRDYGTAPDADITAVTAIEGKWQSDSYENTWYEFKGNTFQSYEHDSSRNEHYTRQGTFRYSNNEIIFYDNNGHIHGRGFVNPYQGDMDKAQMIWDDNNDGRYIPGDYQNGGDGYATYEKQL